MAGKTKIDNSIFASTDKSQYPADNSDLEYGHVIPLGLGLTQGTVDALDAIKTEFGVSRNSLMVFAVRRFLLDYRAGKIDLAPYIEVPPEPNKRLRMPRQ